MVDARDEARSAEAVSTNVSSRCILQVGVERITFRLRIHPFLRTLEPTTSGSIPVSEVVGTGFTERGTERKVIRCDCGAEITMKRPRNRCPDCYALYDQKGRKVDVRKGHM